MSRLRIIPVTGPTSPHQGIIATDGRNYIEAALVVVRLLQPAAGAAVHRGQAELDMVGGITGLVGWLVGSGGSVQ